jgi:hypothetical protein
MKLKYNTGLLFVEIIGRKSGWAYNTTYKLWVTMQLVWNLHPDYYAFLGTDTDGNSDITPKKL